MSKRDIIIEGWNGGFITADLTIKEIDDLLERFKYDSIDDYTKLDQVLPLLKHFKEILTQLQNGILNYGEYDGKGLK